MKLYQAMVNCNGIQAKVSIGHQIDIAIVSSYPLFFTIYNSSAQTRKVPTQYIPYKGS
jgi:hypothetical protein